MRVFGLIGLVLALAIVGVLVKRQIGVVAPPVAVPGASGAAAGASAGSQPDVRTQSQQIRQQFKQSLDSAVQAPRPMPDDN